MDMQLASFVNLLQFDVGQAGQITLAIHRAAGHPAGHLAARVHHRVCRVRHPHASFVEAEAYHLAAAGFLAFQEGLAPDKPGFVGLHIRTKATFSHSKIMRLELARPAPHLVPVEWQTGLGAQRIARPQPNRLHAKRLARF